jgi:hypothetical protein
MGLPRVRLTKLEDGGSFDPATMFGAGALVKSFLLGYTDASSNGNTKKLNSVKDPRNAETKVQYFTSTVFPVLDEQGVSIDHIQR